MSRLPAPPCVPGPALIGNSLRLLRDPLGFPLVAARDWGDVVDLNVPLLPTYSVSHPDLIEQVLVRDHRSYSKDKPTHKLISLLGNGLLTSEGELWRRQRRLVQPGFHRERVASYGEVMVEYTERMLAGFRTGEIRNAHDDMMRLTREIVAKTLFSAEVTGDGKNIGDALEVVVRHFMSPLFLLPFHDKLPTPANRRFQKAVRALDEVIYRIIAERRGSGRDTGDLLSMLMHATDEDGHRMADRQLRDEAMTLFLAGHETTALALTWTWYLVSQHPDVLSKVRRELDEVLGGRSPRVSDIPKLRQVEHVIVESLRLFSPAWAVGREALQDCSIGDYHVPKGMQIWISQWVVHRDPRWFADPDAFLPERWEGDLAKRLPKYAYFPFGGGPRLCIGVAFAMMEAILVFATMAQRIRLSVVPGTVVEPVAAITLRPRNGLPVIVERRDAQAAR